MRRESCPQKPRGHLRDGGNMDGNSIELRALAARRGEQLAVRWIVNHAADQIVPFRETDGDGKPGKFVREVRGAIERVHIPAISRGVLLPASLFRDNGMVRECAPQ